MSEYLLEMKNISKSFFNNPVLNNVSFNVKPGEVRALVGENGAGKSTLMKILAGIYTMDSGEIFLHGKKVDIKTPHDARDLHISLIHQEISLAENLTIAQNIFLGSEFRQGPFKFTDEKEMSRQAQVILDELGTNLHANTIVEKLSVAQQQMVEISKSFCFNAEVIILDEPTAALTDNEIKHLFERIREMKQKGLALIYISHRLEEIFEIADSVTVLRDGDFIGTKPTSELTRDDIVTMMVGREVKQLYAIPQKEAGETIFEVQGLTTSHVNDVSFELKEGEILGFSGLMGSGRTELARAIFGIDKVTSGKMFVRGKEIVNGNPMQAIENGIVLVPEDRKMNGLVLEKDVAYNITLPVIKSFIKGLYVNKAKEKEIIDKYVNSLSIKMSGVDQLCINLSGGNQQKVVISKWLAVGAKILILDEPTRGIDVGAKSEIYHLIAQLADEGYSIIFISSEMPEILNISTRVAVMHEGQLRAILNMEEKTTLQNKIMHIATGGQLS